MLDLRNLNKQELEEFFNSFDVVLSDVDGVVKNSFEDIPGVSVAVKALRQINKRVLFVSNNSAKTLEAYRQEFQKLDIEIGLDDIITPIPVMVSYLKTQNLTNKKVFVLGMTSLRRALEAAGFELAQNGPDRIISESLGDFFTSTIADDESVGAVIIDSDMNLNFVNLQKGISFLLNPEVIFLKGSTDLRAPLGANYVLAGPGYFAQIMESVTRREAIPTAKPSPHLHKYIVDKYKIQDVSRVLFVGDSIPSDMGFAAQSGYKKLLVLSGVTAREEVEKWAFPDEFKPDYYCDSLKCVHDAVQKLNDRDCGSG